MDSLVSQDFDVYEIICVDDGSTDKTGQLLEQYATNSHVRILHKPNGGLSDARNNGVSLSRGRYITFVDGDDVVAPHYVSSLVGAMDNRSGRMVVSLEQSMPYSVTNNPQTIEWKSRGETLHLNRSQMVKEILYDRIHPSANAKLAPREVYEKHPFPIGCLYEEIRTIMTFVGELDDFVVIPSTIYGYIMRDGSITWSKSISVNRLEQYQMAAEIITRDALSICPELVGAAKYQKALLYTRMHSQLPVGVVLPQDIKDKDNEIQNMVKSLVGQIKKDNEVPFASKFRMQLFVSAPHLYDKCYALYRTKIKGVR